MSRLIFLIFASFILENEWIVAHIPFSVIESGSFSSIGFIPDIRASFIMD